MTRRCSVTGKGTQFGNNVSHANNKTRRRFQPNIQDKSIYSDALGRMVRLRLSTHALRSIEHRGGLDAYLLDVRATALGPGARKIRKQIERAQQQALQRGAEAPAPAPAAES